MEEYEMEDVSQEPKEEEMVMIEQEKDEKEELERIDNYPTDIKVLMEESKNLAQKALFECTEDELKEKESQAWHWESKEELGNLDYNRIVIEEDIPGNIYDLRNKWVTFYEEEGNIGNNDASVKKNLVLTEKMMKLLK